MCPVRGNRLEVIDQGAMHADELGAAIQDWWQLFQFGSEVNSSERTSDEVTRVKRDERLRLDERYGKPLLKRGIGVIGWGRGFS